MARLPAERGGALVLALLMLIALTGLGLLSVSSSRMGVAMAGNFRVAKQARYVAEAGLIRVAHELNSDPVGFARQAATRFDQIRWTLGDFGSNQVFITEDDDPAKRSMGFDARPVDFEVRVASIIDLPACPGSAPGTVCCMKVRLVSEGRVGDMDSEGLPLEGTSSATQRVQAEYPIPYPCPR